MNFYSRRIGFGLLLAITFLMLPFVTLAWKKQGVAGQINVAIDGNSHTFLQVPPPVDLIGIVNQSWDYNANQSILNNILVGTIGAAKVNPGEGTTKYFSVHNLNNVSIKIDGLETSYTNTFKGTFTYSVSSDPLIIGPGGTKEISVDIKVDSDCPQGTFEATPMINGAHGVGVSAQSNVSNGCASGQPCGPGPDPQTQICQNQCSYSGQMQCNGSGYQTCVNNGSCNIWSSITSCGSNQTCQNGICQNNSPATVAQPPAPVTPPTDSNTNITISSPSIDRNNAPSNNTNGTMPNPSSYSSGLNQNTTTQTQQQTSNNTSSTGYINPNLQIPATFSFQATGYTKEMGFRDAEILYLQRLLNYLDCPVAYIGAGSKGYETDYFGTRTFFALIQFQTKNKISVTGKLDRPTKDFLNDVLINLKQISAYPNLDATVNAGNSNSTDPLNAGKTSFITSAGGFPLGVISGIVEGGISIFDGLGNLIFNSEEVGQNIASAVSNPDKIVEAIYQGLQGRVTAILYIDSSDFISFYNAGDAVGKTAVDYYTIAGGGIILKGSQAIKIPVDVSKTTEKATEIAKIKQALVVNEIKTISRTADLKALWGASEVKLSFDVWIENALIRGKKIDNILGNNAGACAKCIDIFNASDKSVTSIKSIDITTATYKTSSNIVSKLKGYTDALAEYPGGRVNGLVYPIHAGDDFTNKVLNVALPDVGFSTGQFEAITAAKLYAESKGIKFIITIIK